MTNAHGSDGHWKRIATTETIIKPGAMKTKARVKREAIASPTNRRGGVGGHGFSVFFVGVVVAFILVLSATRME